jgi:methionyl-tRNA formyltransferase
MKFVFFGSSELSVYVLEKLKSRGIYPVFIVTTRDKAKGRKLVLSPNIVKTWAIENKIDFIDPKSLKDEDVEKILRAIDSDLFLVASYGKIIPDNIFNIPLHKTLNIHPSLLPKYRGASPIQSQILLDDKNVGVTIIMIDSLMDHGPILIQNKVSLDNWPIGRIELEKVLAEEGAILFEQIYEDWIEGKIKPIIQNENTVTVCTKITKEDGLIDRSSDPYKNLLKIKALEGWPGTYFFIKRNNREIRVLIKQAKIEDGELILERVLPEGKTEMSYSDFERGYK